MIKKWKGLLKVLFLIFIKILKLDMKWNGKLCINNKNGIIYCKYICISNSSLKFFFFLVENLYFRG